MFYVYGYKYVTMEDGTVKEISTFKGTTETKEQAITLCKTLAKDGNHTNVINNGYIVYHV